MAEILYPELEENKKIYMGRKSKTSNNMGLKNGWDFYRLRWRIGTNPRRIDGKGRKIQTREGGANPGKLIAMGEVEGEQACE